MKYWRRCCSRGRAVPGPAMLALAAVCACSSGDAPKSAGPARRDSVGIEIVENTAPLWANGQGWTVVDSPLVDIGGVAGDPAYDLAQVSGVVLLPSMTSGPFVCRVLSCAGLVVRSSSLL